MLASFLDEIKEEIDEDNSVSLNDDSLSIASTSNGLDKFDEIVIACSPPQRCDPDSGKRNYMGSVVKDQFNEKNYHMDIEIIS